MNGQGEATTRALHLAGLVDGLTAERDAAVRREFRTSGALGSATVERDRALARVRALEAEVAELPTEAQMAEVDAALAELTGRVDDLVRQSAALEAGADLALERMTHLFGQRAAARALHLPVPSMFPPTCSGCGSATDEDGSAMPAPWPCATAEALGASDGRPFTDPYPADERTP